MLTATAESSQAVSTPGPSEERPLVGRSTARCPCWSTPVWPPCASGQIPGHRTNRYWPCRRTTRSTTCSAGS